MAIANPTCTTPPDFIIAMDGSAHCRHTHVVCVVWLRCGCASVCSPFLSLSLSLTYKCIPRVHHTHARFMADAGLHSKRTNTNGNALAVASCVLVSVRPVCVRLTTPPTDAANMTRTVYAHVACLSRNNSSDKLCADCLRMHTLVNTFATLYLTMPLYLLRLNHFVFFFSSHFAHFARFPCSAGRKITSIKSAMDCDKQGCFDYLLLMI